METTAHSMLLFLLLTIPSFVVHGLTQTDVERQCEMGTAKLIPHPTACERYFDCSDTAPRNVNSYFTRYEQECKHPQLFDIQKMMCVDFPNAKCGAGRKETKWRCDYLSYRCLGNHCRPCWLQYPSCVGKADGIWPHPNKIWSPYFVTCMSERSKSGQEMCGHDSQTGKQKLFDPVQRRCVTPSW